MDPVHGFPQRVAVPQQVKSCLSRSEANPRETFSDEPDQLRWVRLNVVPLPTLIVSRMSGRFLMDQSKPEGLLVLGEASHE